MPRYNNDLHVRAQVLESHRALDDLTYLPETVEGSIIRRTKTMLNNIDLGRKNLQQQELRWYYQVGQLWAEEVELIGGERIQRQLRAGLQSMIPRHDARAAERIFEMFRHRPEGLRRLKGVGYSQISNMTTDAFRELVGEIQQIRNEVNLLEQYLDI
jgi:hypothetical protein